jgi:hypothetical protein
VTSGGLIVVVSVPVTPPIMAVIVPPEASRAAWEVKETVIGQVEGAVGQRVVLAQGTEPPSSTMSQLWPISLVPLGTEVGVE